MTTFHSTRQHFALCHAHSRTDGPEVTVIYAGQNLKSNTSCRCNFLIISFDALRLQLRVLQEWLQVTLTSIYSTIVCLSLINFRWKWIITETCCKRILKETPCCFSFATGSMMIKYRARKWLRWNNYGNIYVFYSCLEWRANNLWLRIQTGDPSRFDNSTFIILFLTSYFIVSKWWPMTEWNKSYFFFRS